MCVLDVGIGTKRVEYLNEKLKTVDE